MAESYLTLLQEGNRVTADAMDRIARASSEHMKLQQQQSQFDSEMTLRGAQFAQQERQLQSQIQHTKNQDYFAQKEYELKRQVAPLEIQTANLRLESEKAKYAYNKQKVDTETFNSITDIHDEQMGSVFLKSQNMNQIQDYQNLKIKYKSEVAQGAPFNNAQFESEKQEIIQKYSDSPPSNSPWNGQTRYALGVVNPKLELAYDQLNPKIKLQKDALASSYYTMDDKEAFTFFTTYGSLYNPEEVGNLLAGRTLTKHNYSRTNGAYDQMGKLQSKLATLNPENDPVGYNHTVEDIKRLREESSSLLKQSQLMQQEASLGRYGFGKTVENPQGLTEFDLERKAKEVERLKRLAIESKDAVNKKKSLLGIDDFADAEGQGIRTRINEVGSLIIGDKTIPVEDESLKNTELDGSWRKGMKNGSIGFGWFGENRPDEIADRPTMSRIKDQVYENIESMENAGIKFKDRFNSERVNGLIGTLSDDVNVPISDFAFELLANQWGLNPASAKKDAGFYEVGAKKREYQITFGPKSSIPIIGGFIDKQTITNYQDILKITKSIEKVAERELVQKELYSALISATSLNAVQAK